MPDLAHLREMVWIFPVTAAATVAFLVLGTLVFPDAPADGIRKGCGREDQRDVDEELWS